MAHLDLKPSNLTVAKTLNLKLIDFSESVVRDHEGSI